MFVPAYVNYFVLEFVHELYGTHGTFGDRAFAAAGPGLWNSLPPHLRAGDLPYGRFRWIVGPQGSVNYFNCAVYK